MKSLIVAALAIFGLAGCIAVPGPYGADAYYYPAPAVGIYAAPGYGRDGGHHGGHHRGHHGGHHRYGHDR